MKIIAIIPARYKSTRFLGKVLKKIGEKTVLRHVYENTKKCNLLSGVYVATDSEDVKNEVLSFGGNCIMTGSYHNSGTDRIAEACVDINCDVIVNVQGDEPFVHSDMIKSGIELFFNNPELEFATLRTKIEKEEDYLDPNVVKLVCDVNGYALYFSRSAIPFVREGGFIDTKSIIWKHVGMYFYKKEFLLRYVKLPDSNLEKTEKLEQLRALENGIRIMTGITERKSIGIDVPKDLEKAQKIYESRGEFS